MVTDEEIISALDAADRGEMELSFDTPFDDGYFLTVEFRLGNGWVVRVFNDCGGWDYIDSIAFPDGTEIRPIPDDHQAEVMDCAYWEPKNPKRWGAEKAFDWRNR